MPEDDRKREGEQATGGTYRVTPEGEVYRTGELTPADRRELEELPELPGGPGFFRTALTETLKYESVRRAFIAYARAVEAVARAQRAWADLDEATVEHARAHKKLDDINDILAADTHTRKARVIRKELEHRVAEALLERFKEGKMSESQLADYLDRFRYTDEEDGDPFQWLRDDLRG